MNNFNSGHLTLNNLAFKSLAEFSQTQDIQANLVYFEFFENLRMTQNSSIDFIFKLELILDILFFMKNLKLFLFFFNNLIGNFFLDVN